MPDGKRFAIKLMVEGEARPVMTRAGSMIAQQWRQFGIDATTESAQAAFLTRRNGGDFEAIITWSVETWGGHPDLSFFLDSWHSQFVQPAGKVQTPRNWSRWSNPELDKIIEQIRAIGFDDPKGIELGQEYVKLAVQEMPIIPLMSYNVFTVMDETYWTGYPTAEDPYTNPVPNWGNSRYMMVQAEAGRSSSRPHVASGGGDAPPRFADTRSSPCAATASTSLKRLAQFVLVVFIGIIADLLHHASDADRSGRADDRVDDRLRQHQPRGGRR